MGKPGPAQTPITARIKRTTKGGITQPILNMGAPVKMKRTPAKKSVDKAAEAKRKKAISKGLDDQKAEGYLNDSAFNDSNMDGTMASRAIKGLYRAGKKAAMRATGGAEGGAMAEAEGIKNRRDDNNDYNNSHYIKFKGDNPDLFKSGVGAEDPVKVDPVKVDPKKTTKSYVKKGGTATGNMKDYKTGSQKRRDEYTARGWKQDKTTAVKGGVKADTVKEIKITTKVDPTKKITKVDPTKKTTKVTTTKNTKVTSAPKETSKRDVRKAVRKTNSADRKDNRAARVRQKGIDALASGDKKKALRLKQRETRIKKRATKKRGQAANAIDPTK